MLALSQVLDGRLVWKPKLDFFFGLRTILVCGAHGLHCHLAAVLASRLVAKEAELGEDVLDDSGHLDKIAFAALGRTRQHAALSGFFVARRQAIAAERRLTVLALPRVQEYFGAQQAREVLEGLRHRISRVSLLKQTQLVQLR